MSEEKPSIKDNANAAIDQGQGGELVGSTKTCSAPLARSPVEKLADEVRHLPKKSKKEVGIEGARPGTVARLVTSKGNEITGRSKFADTDLDPILQEILKNIPEDERTSESQHGRCAEINAIDKALKAGEDIRGAIIQTARVKVPGNSEHGTPHEPCDTCRVVLKQLGVTYV